MRSQQERFTERSVRLHTAPVVALDRVGGGFFLSLNSILVRIFLFPTLPAGDESECRFFATFPTLNWLRIGYVKSFLQVPLVLIGCERNPSMPAKALAIYGWLIL